MTHTVVRMRVVKDNTGVHKMLPVIVTEGGPLLPLVCYMRSPQARPGRSSQEKLVQVVGLLLDC
jgi:hypothetical protein